jgi:hypothetical protein
MARPARPPRARRTAALAALAATGALLGACSPSDRSSLEPLPVDARPNQAPVVSIAAPAPGAVFTRGQSVAFSGTAADPEDGQVWGTAMVWTSDRDGLLHDGRTGGLGPGTAFHWEELSAGRHVVTLAAKDQRGATAQATVTVTVDP